MPVAKLPQSVQRLMRLLARQSGTGNDTLAGNDHTPLTSPSRRAARSREARCLRAASVRPSRSASSRRRVPPGIVKLRLTAVSDPQHGGFTAGSSPVSWGSSDELFVNLTVRL